jgi:glutathione S-transferase
MTDFMELHPTQRCPILRGSDLVYSYLAERHDGQGFDLRWTDPLRLEGHASNCHDTW